MWSASPRKFRLCLIALTVVISASASTADQALTHAQKLIAEGDEAGALVELNTVLQTEPDNLFALGNVGLISARRGEFARAEQCLSRAHRIKPDDAKLALALLEVYARNGNKIGAERVATDIRARVKLQSAQALGAAQLLWRLGRMDAAAAMAESAPMDTVEFHDLLGSIYYTKGDVKGASQEWQRSIQLAPNSAERYFRLGMLYLKYRTPSLATIIFGHGVAQVPGSPALWMGLGISQCLDEKLADAEQSLHKAIELNPRVADAYLLLGDILEQEKPGEALEMFRRIMTAHPDLAVAHYYYGRLALQLNEGRIEDTVAILRKAVALEPGFADSHYELGRALETAGETDEAIRQFRECLQLDPKLFKAQYRLAILYKKRGESARSVAALKAFEQAQKSGNPETELKQLEYTIGQP
jgi:tetratricopeptide (TPR) repeat protein